MRSSVTLTKPSSDAASRKSDLPNANIAFIGVEPIAHRPRRLSCFRGERAVRLTFANWRSPEPAFRSDLRVARERRFDARSHHSCADLGRDESVRRQDLGTVVHG
jgi:hypothetical protein